MTVWFAAAAASAVLWALLLVRARAGRHVGWIGEIEALRNTTHRGHYAPRNLGDVRPEWGAQEAGMR